MVEMICLRCSFRSPDGGGVRDGLSACGQGYLSWHVCNRLHDSGALKEALREDSLLNDLVELVYCVAAFYATLVRRRLLRVLPVLAEYLFLFLFFIAAFLQQDVLLKLRYLFHALA